MNSFIFLAHSHKCCLFFRMIIIIFIDLTTYIFSLVFIISNHKIEEKTNKRTKFENKESSYFRFISGGKGVEKGFTIVARKPICFVNKHATTTTTTTSQPYDKFSVVNFVCFLSF